MKNIELMKLVEEKLKVRNRYNLEIGFFENAKYPNGAYVATIAKYQEYGTINIPARPFFRNAINSKYQAWLNVYGKSLKNNDNYKLTLSKTGEVARNDIVKSITSINEPPLKQSTIKAKGSSNPLIDTGLLRRSVSYKVVSK